MRQLALLGLVQDLARDGGQVIVATHAPILMGAPGATILELTDDGLAERAFDELEHVQLLRSFLDDREAFLRHL